jgi:hypothetical protein
MTASVVGWEQVRAPIAEWYEGDTLVLERMRPEPSEFELWVKTPDVQAQLNLMYERHLIDESEAELKAQQKELEKKKEELRAKELQSPSLP